jgi:hypothetical protein
LVVLLGALLTAWLIGLALHLGTGPVSVLLLVSALVGLARMPWRRAR